jgi:hypothetical protein
MKSHSGREGCRAVDLIVALPIGEPDWNVCHAKHDRAGGLEPLHWKAIGFGPPIPKIRVAPGCRQAGDRELLLDGHRQSKQRPTLTTRERGISIVSCRACPVEVAHNDRVDLWIKRLDARNRVVDKLAGGDLPRGEGL